MKKRVIDRLRAKYPGSWTYDAEDHSWSHEDGWKVRPYAELAPRFDGDDDSFSTSYRRTDTGERVLSGILGLLELGRAL